ncbi:MAG: phosphatidylserine decarboxylase family protein [Syntrophomonadaceae bacterium]|nr:phosphatidylserine decarboxylase family protein [Syntrophomonadaceae bacterium]
MAKNFIVAKEGWIFVIIPFLFFVVLLLSGHTAMAVIAFLLSLFCAFFFRNPVRVPAQQEGTILAPADGRVMSIEKVYEDNFLKSECYRVRIFLSIFNVHINRTPIEGYVDWVKRQGGSCMAAYKKEAGEINARNYVGINSDYGPLLVVQITGLIARRIVCWVEPGDYLASGQRFGLIRFGSCTELYFPLEAETLSAAGDKVKGGTTVIARFNEQYDC